MPGTNLIVPVVLWGKHAPTHCVSSIYMSRDQKTLVTGCYDGQLCIWQVDPESLKMTPRCLLVGHTAPVTCLSRASIIQVCVFMHFLKYNLSNMLLNQVDGFVILHRKLIKSHDYALGLMTRSN